MARIGEMRGYGPRAVGAKTVAALALLLATGGCSRAEEKPVARSGDLFNGYPAPRFPAYLADPNDGDLVSAARILVRQPHGLAPLGIAEPGQTVHVILQLQQDMEVWGAIQRAWAERGVKAIGLPIWTVAGMSKEEYAAKSQRMNGEEGWKELGVFEPAYLPYLPAEAQKELGQPLTIMGRNRLYLGKYLDQHPEIKHVFTDPGGGSFFFIALAGKQHADKFMGNWMYEDKTDLLMRFPSFPSDVWSLIEDKIVQPIDKVSEGTFVDPEGTSLRWSVTRPQAVKWKQFASLANNHLFLYPHPRDVSSMTGVVCGGANHIGFYPRMCVHLDQRGKIIKVDGGGRTGDLFRGLVTDPRFAAVKFPTAQSAGYWYLSPDGFATNPKFVRNMETLVRGSTDFTNLSERQRGGVQHFSFSSYAGLFDFTEEEIDKAISENRGMGDLFNSDPRDVRYVKSLKLPVSHTMHVHVYFGSINYRLRDNGELIPVSSKGRVAAYDNAEVRALAAKYGNPDEVLSYDWVPGIPGINMDGDYANDYARNPWAWITREWNEIKSGKYEFLWGGEASGKKG